MLLRWGFRSVFVVAHHVCPSRVCDGGHVFAVYYSPVSGNGCLYDVDGGGGGNHRRRSRRDDGGDGAAGRSTGCEICKGTMRAPWSFGSGRRGGTFLSLVSLIG